jgi:glycine cleavage system H protein
LDPDDRRYTTEHEWVQRRGDRVRVGITRYAQDALGDIVFVSLPSLGAALGAGESLGEVESTKSVSDIYAPVTGTVLERNDALDAAPELVNSDPYGDGWMLSIRIDNSADSSADAAGDTELLDAAGYQSTLGS